MHTTHPRFRRPSRAAVLLGSVLLGAALAQGPPAAADPPPRLANPPSLEPLRYGTPGQTTDLGVGLWAWPMPLDADGDGDFDLLVSSPDVPYNGTWFFENTTGDVAYPVFAEPVRLSQGLQDTAVSHVNGRAIVTRPGATYPDVGRTGLTRAEPIPAERPVHTPVVPGGDLRNEQWIYSDLTGDGELDLVVGVGDWSEYGWDDAYDEDGNWTNGPLHGFVYLLRNTGTTANPAYADPVKIQGGGKPIDAYGNPTPAVADFTGDGKPDIVTGEFLDKLTFYGNAGGATTFTEGRQLRTDRGDPLAMDLQMIIVSAVDWTKDGHPDLVVGQEDGRVALVEHTGRVQDGTPVFKAPRFFQQKAGRVKVGALSTPTAVDWDGDGRQDLISGDTSGRISFVRNLGGGDPPRWDRPRPLAAGGRLIRHQAGPNGSIQGPAEAKWGYTEPVAADWNHDGLPDLVVNDIWGKVVWYENIGTRRAPELAAARPVEVDWPGTPPKPAWNWWNPKGRELVTQWRTTPYATDLNRDGLTDLVMLDHEGYLAFFERRRDLLLKPGRRIFIGEDGSSRFTDNGTPQAGPRGPLQLNTGVGGKSGRRTFTMVDWTRDGRLDLVVNDTTNVGLLENVGTDDEPWVFRNRGSIGEGDLVGHTTYPTVVSWDRSSPAGDRRPALLIGAEDGGLYYQPWNGDRRPERISTPAPGPRALVGSWGFGERHGTVARDASGYANHGVVDGAAWLPSGALRFDGFNDHVDLDRTVSPYLAGATGITLAARVRPDTLDSRQARIFGTRINGGTAGFEVTFENDNGRPRIAIAGRSAASDSYQKVAFDAAGVRLGEWHEITASIDFTAKRMRLFVDGAERPAIGTPQLAFDSPTYVLGTPTQPDTIGRGPDGSAPFRGALDDVRLYRTPR
ncbi:FG-GAP-like repeat-containing protein [Actinomadura sp. 1N219]|uniref:FG-GAP-like repeat-containing protein n=1 Tax=Actinomadura sp. 1N219 TaxID=3375152 RepID=UPI0037A95730